MRRLSELRWQCLSATSAGRNQRRSGASGCLCCTIRGDLAKTLREAPGRFARGGEPWFDRVVIETTGFADPAPILHTRNIDESVIRDTLGMFTDAKAQGPERLPVEPGDSDIAVSEVRR